MPRFATLALLLALTTGCNKAGSDSTAGPPEGQACMTDAAREVTTRPDFEAGYRYCATGSRAIGGPATIACVQKQTGLPEACASCYSWYKACVLRHCFNACNTTRPEPNCRLCSRNNCRGMFYQCAGTQHPFPGTPSGD